MGQKKSDVAGEAGTHNSQTWTRQPRQRRTALVLAQQAGAYSCSEGATQRR